MSTNNAKSEITKSNTQPTYRKSSRCGNSSCVAVAVLDNGAVLVKDTKDESLPPLSFTQEEWAAFVDGVKNNEFNA